MNNESMVTTRDLGFDTIAKKVVNDCMRLRKGDHVLITVGLDSLRFGELIGLECYRVGAIPLIAINSDYYRTRVWSEIPSEILSLTPQHLLALYRMLDATIAVETVSDPLSIKRIPEESIAARQRATKPISDIMFERKIKWIYIGFPTKQMARFYRVPYRSLFHMFKAALSVDYRELKVRGKAVARHMTTAKQVTVTQESGTNITFGISGRPVHVDDGTLSDEDIKNGHVGFNLPAGEVYIAPLEDSANGTVVFPTPVDYFGRRIERLRLTFKNGRVIESSAERGINIFRGALNAAEGDKDRLGEFGIGLNEHITRTVGYTVMDEKMVGSVHFALGENRFFGGRNNSNMHWDLVLPEPDVMVNDKVIMERGRLVLD